MLKIGGDYQGLNAALRGDERCMLFLKSIHSTAAFHSRIFVIDLIGHHSSWMILYAGMAGGADVILLPELGYDLDELYRMIQQRVEKGKHYSIIAVAEGISVPKGKRPAAYISQEIEKNTGLEARETVLGYIQRGGSPSPFDRNLATRLGGHATELIAQKQFGRMVCLKGDEVSSIPLQEVAGKLRLVTPGHDLITQGRRMGISFGVRF